LVHAAAGVARRLITLVELIVLIPKRQGLFMHSEYITQAVEYTLLRSAWHKLRHGNSQRDTGLAAITVGPVGKGATAPKSHLYEVAIDLGSNEVVRCGYLRSGLSAPQITAGVGRCHIKLQRRNGKVTQTGHA
jgi:hypothetical protein